MRSLRPVGLDFFQAPPAVLENARELPCSAQKAFETLADTPSWSRWFDDMKSARWTSAAPFGVGSTRSVSLGVTEADERMMAWEPGKRFAFMLTGIGLPLVKAMAEDWRIESTGPATCKLTHRVAYDPTFLTRALHPVVRLVFGRQFRRSLTNLASYVERV